MTISNRAVRKICFAPAKISLPLVKSLITSADYMISTDDYVISSDDYVISTGD